MIRTKLLTVEVKDTAYGLGHEPRIGLKLRQLVPQPPRHHNHELCERHGRPPELPPSHMLVLAELVGVHKGSLVVKVMRVSAWHPLKGVPCHLAEATHAISRHVPQDLGAILVAKLVPVVMLVPPIIVQPKPGAAHILTPW